MASEIIQPVAEKLVLELIPQITIDGYDNPILGGSGGSPWEPQSFDAVPAGAVGPPEIRRHAVEEGELQLGTVDWFLEFPVSLYFDLDEAIKSQTNMVAAVEQFAALIDSDPSLQIPGVDDCKLTSAEPFVEKDRGRPLCGYLCTVQVFRLVEDVS